MELNLKAAEKIAKDRGPGKGKKAKYTVEQILEARKQLTKHFERIPTIDEMGAALGLSGGTVSQYLRAAKLAGLL
jgi:sigma-70-like protein